MQTFEKLEIWKESINLATKIYEITKDFPKNEAYGLASQIQRAAVSVPSNIAEGSSRQYKKEFINFLYISKGSLSELLTQLKISEKIKYINKEQYEQLKTTIYTLIRKINGLIKSLKTNENLR